MRFILIIMSVVFILPSIPAPRHVKRIRALAKEHEITVLCARRINMDLYQVENIPNVSYITVDMVIPPATKPIQRIVASLKFGKFVKKHLQKLAPKVVYVAGLDTLAIACKLTTNEVKICYEVGDLRESFTNKPKDLLSRLSVRSIIDDIIRRRERKLSNRISLLILTSKKFYDVHYKYLVSENKMIEIPNMPVLSAFESYTPKKDGKFTIGFVGALRYINQMYMLVDAAKEADVNVIFSGSTALDIGNKFQEYCKDKPWVSFTGTYNFSIDIANIYGKLDCVYSVYDASNFNVRVALPNKLYEAAICKLPIIVAKNTYLFELVEKWGTGVGVDFNDKDELIKVINRLKIKDDYYQSFRRNCDRIIPTIDANDYLNALCLRVNNLVNQNYDD